MEHRPSAIPRHRTLFWAALAIPDQLVPCCFTSASVSRLHLLRGRPLFLFPCGFQVRAWRVVLDAEVVSYPAPLPPQYLLGYWFLSRPLAPQTGVEERLDLLLRRLCCPPCLTSVEQDWLHIGVEDVEFGSHADFSRCFSFVLVWFWSFVGLFLFVCLFCFVLFCFFGLFFFSMTKDALALPILAATYRSVPPCWDTSRAVKAVRRASSPGTQSSDEHNAAVFANVCRRVMGCTKECVLRFGQLANTRTERR